MSSTFGYNFKISIFGQSHSEAIGVVIDGMPSGTVIDMDKLDSFMNRRLPVTRHEADEVHFISGVVNGVTCGAPICAVIMNKDAKPQDYESIHFIPRPAHSDYSAYCKYGEYHDIRGGGHFSGRLTAPLCVAGALAIQMLKNYGVTVEANIIDSESLCRKIEYAKSEGDSVGGMISCVVEGLKAGIGSPMFDGVENRIAQSIFAIPAIKAIEFGDTREYGSQNNDSFRYNENGEVITETNHHGGILGGITSGMPVTFKVLIKPTPSIAIEQKTVNLKLGQNATLTVMGRHDTCIVLRAVPCVEAAAAVALIDLILGDKK